MKNPWFKSINFAGGGLNIFPISLQGWLCTLIYLTIVVITVLISPRNGIIYVWLVSAVFMYISAKTSGNGLIYYTWLGLGGRAKRRTNRIFGLINGTFVLLIGFFGISKHTDDLFGAMICIIASFIFAWAYAKYS